MKKESKLRKIISYIISILSLIICILITIEVIAASNESRPPKILGYSLSYVPTPSMEPEIMAGDYVLYKSVDFDDCNIDDIIVYKNSEGLYVIHRIIKDNDDHFIVKGDNNLLEDDDIVTPDNLYAKYVCNVDILSIFSGGISKNAIFFILIIIFIIMIGMQIVSIVIKEKTASINEDVKSTEAERELLLEQMKNQILQEELEKLKQKNNNNE